MEEDNGNLSVSIKTSQAIYVNKSTKETIVATEGMKVRYNPNMQPLVDTEIIGNPVLAKPFEHMIYTIREVKGPFLLLNEIEHGSHAETGLEPGYPFVLFYPI